MATVITDSGAAAIGALLLAIYLGVVVYGIVAPVSAHDPQRGQAVGCLAIVALALLAAEAALGFAWYSHRGFAVRTIAAAAAFPLVSALLSGLGTLRKRLTGASGPPNQ